MNLLKLFEPKKESFFNFFQPKQANVFQNGWNFLMKKGNNAMLYTMIFVKFLSFFAFSLISWIIPFGFLVTILEYTLLFFLSKQEDIVFNKDKVVPEIGFLFIGAFHLFMNLIGYFTGITLLSISLTTSTYIVYAAVLTASIDTKDIKNAKDKALQLINS